MSWIIKILAWFIPPAYDWRQDAHAQVHLTDQEIDDIHRGL